MNFISLGFWAAFCAFFLIYVFVKKWSRTAMLLWVLAFDLFFFWQANGWLMLLLPATAAVNYYLTEFMRKSGAAAESCGRADGNYFPDKFAGKPISAPPSTKPPHTSPPTAVIPSFADLIGDLLPGRFTKNRLLTPSGC